MKGTKAKTKKASSKKKSKTPESEHGLGTVFYFDKHGRGMVVNMFYKEPPSKDHKNTITNLKKYATKFAKGMGKEFRLFTEVDNPLSVVIIIDEKP